MLDLIIIGGGPAGLTSAIYAARKKLNFKVVSQKIGGEQLLITSKIENYPSLKSVTGIEFIQKIREHVEKYKVEIAEGQEVVKIGKQDKGFLIKTRTDQEYTARAIIIASGKKPSKLNVPGEKEFESRGVSYCSICDAPLFRGEIVAVIGGGNAGLESALDLAKYAEKIYILERSPKIIGDKILQEQLKKTGKIRFINSTIVQEIKGGKFVSSLIYQDKEAKEVKELLVRGVFIHVGSVSSVDFIRDFLEINNANEIVIDPETNQTSVQGIFAAGDITNVKWKQIIVAAGEGAKAALSASQYLS